MKKDHGMDHGSRDLLQVVDQTYGEEARKEGENEERKSLTSFD